MYVNKIVKVEAVDGGWKVEARTPDGMTVVRFGAESAEQTVDKPCRRWGGGDQAEPGRTGRGAAPLGVTATRRARSGTAIIKRRIRVWIT